jgi:predicted metal-dependent hydrolase
MGDRIMMQAKEITVTDLTVEWIKKRGLKHAYIQIKDGRVLLKTHTRYPLFLAKLLIEHKRSWINKHLSSSPKSYFLFGQEISSNKKITKEYAKEIMTPIIEEISKMYSYSYQKVRFRCTKTIWGSCSAHNDITLSVNLLQTPLSCIRYVIAHELVHTKIKNHSKVFWEELSMIIPEHKKERALLKEYSKKIFKV